MNRIKTLVLVLFVFGSLLTSAQPGDRERIKQLKIAFISEELDLTTEEGQRFWPIYNTFEDERHSHEKRMRKMFKALDEKSDLTAQDILQANDRATEERIAMAKSEQKYVQEVTALLGPKRALVLLQSEDKFRKRVLEELRDRRK
jgi:Skp family chaperone for outer membrane proteins